MLYDPKNDAMEQKECNTHREVIWYQTEMMQQHNQLLNQKEKTWCNKKKPKRNMMQQKKHDVTK